MTTQLTPIAVGDQIYSFPEALASEIKASRKRFDAMTEEDDESDEDEDDDESESKAAFLKRMAEAKSKVAKKDSTEPELIDQLIDRIDSLETEKQDSDAEREVLAAMLQQQVHGDAMEDEYEDEEMDDRTPQEIAMELLAEFEDAKPFLGPDARISDYGDIYDIYEDAISTRHPGLLLGSEGDLPDNRRVDPDDADELRGAFNLMCFMANPMQRTPVMDSKDADKDADRAFSASLGVRSDSLTPVMPSAPTLKPLY